MKWLSLTSTDRKKLVLIDIDRAVCIAQADEYCEIYTEGSEEPFCVFETVPEIHKMMVFERIEG